MKSSRLNQIPVFRCGSHVAFMLALLAVTGAHAQESLSIEDAVARALQNNLGIRMAQQQAEISEVGNTWGAAGALPQIGLSASAADAVSDQSENPTSFIQERLESQSVNTGAQLSWVLFDGMGMFANKRALEQLERQSEGQSTLVIEQTISATLQAYNGVLVQRALSDVLTSAIEVSRERLDWMDARTQTGAASTFDRLQFENALLSDSLSLLQQRANEYQAVLGLNRLMGEDADHAWEFISPLTPPSVGRDFNQLVERAMGNATAIENALISKELAEIGVQQAQARLSPSLLLTANQGDQQSRFNAGELSADGRTKSLAANLTLNFNLFNGGASRRAIQQAKIQRAMAENQAEDERREVDRLLHDAWSRWTTFRGAYAISERLTENSHRAIQIAEERLASGAINSLDFRETQTQLLNAEQQQLQSLNAWQSADIELRRLSGEWAMDLKEE